MSVRIAILVEGETEKAFLPAVRRFLEPRLVGRMPKLVPNVFDGRLPKADALRRRVQLLLSDSADFVVALTDVYTGTTDFSGAADAKAKMKQWVGEEPRFHAHVALHEFEAWLLPYWSDFAKLAGGNRTKPAQHPERVNHTKPPSQHLEELFRTGSRGRSYSKTIHAKRILDGADISVAAKACPELRAFLNTILDLAGGEAA